jgi:hypothetical protein
MLAWQRVEGSSSEGDPGTTGNSKWTKLGKLGWLANYHVNMAISQQLFTTDNIKSVTM